MYYFNGSLLFIFNAEEPECGFGKLSVFTSLKSWEDAKAYCEQQGTNIIKIVSQEKHDYVVNILKDQYSR